MTTPPYPVIAACGLFVVAAMLWYQANATGLSESFRDLPAIRPPLMVSPPVAGRPYGAAGEDNVDPYFAPADLNKAPLAGPPMAVPTSQTRPVTVPGPGTAPKDALAASKDLEKLDVAITVWLDGASQRENAQPGSLTADQLQERVMLQGRLRQIRDQLGTGMITDTYKVVAQETQDVQEQNAGWQQAEPHLAALHEFGIGLPADAFLTTGQYTQFRGLFNAAINQLKGLMQPDPVQRIRLQQLQVMSQSLADAEHRFHPPPIKAGAARQFLRTMLRPTQPLPTLFAMEPNPATLAAATPTQSPADIIRDLRDIQWRLTVTYNPAEQELQRAIAAMLQRLQTGAAGPEEIQAARNQVASLHAQSGPVPVAPAAMMSPGASLRPRPTAGTQPIAYDPTDLVKRANVLCKQVAEAFPHDATALGCPKSAVSNDYEAETTINTVCDRLRYSVPDVSPEQFNCPKRVV
jgi:hypothetical protein